MSRSKHDRSRGSSNRVSLSKKNLNGLLVGKGGLRNGGITGAAYLENGYLIIPAAAGFRAKSSIKNALEAIGISSDISPKGGKDFVQISPTEFRKFKNILKRWKAASTSTNPTDHEDSKIKVFGPEANQDLHNLVTEIDEDQQGVYSFNQDSGSREMLRQQLREMHYGKQERNNPNLDINHFSRYSPLDHILNHRGTIGINVNGDIVINPEYQAMDISSTLSYADIKEQQEAVQIWYDSSKLTEQEVKDIQHLKAGLAINAPLGKTQKQYMLELEEKASYLAVRGEVKQLYTMRKARNIGDLVLQQPRSRIIYYTNFPKLQGHESLDVLKFVRRDNGQLQKYQKLKEKFKAVIKLQVIVANANNEGLDVVTPNAFFYALKDSNELAKAKVLFAQAVREVAEETDPDKYPDFKGLFVHDTLGMKEIMRGDVPQGMEKVILGNENKAGTTRALQDWAQRKLRTPLKINVIVHNQDASSPQLAGSKSNFRVAEALMGEAIGAVGNGALGSRAEQAKEENDTRQFGGGIECVFNPNMNKSLLKPAIMHAVSIKDQPTEPSIPMQNVQPPLSPRFHNTNAVRAEQQPQQLPFSNKKAKKIVPNQTATDSGSIVNDRNFTKFQKIYKALYDGDNLFKRQSSASKNLYHAKSYDQKIADEINKHIQNKPKSRAAEAWNIMKDYEKNPHRNKKLELFKSIYLVSSRGFFSIRGINVEQYNKMEDIEHLDKTTHKRTRKILEDLKDLDGPGIT